MGGFPVYKLINKIWMKCGSQDGCVDKKRVELGRVYEGREAYLQHENSSEWCLKVWASALSGDFAWRIEVLQVQSTRVGLEGSSYNNMLGCEVTRI